MLEIKNVDKAFKNITVLEDVSIVINDNEVVGLLGPNGAGKTTLIKIICKLITPDRGSVEINKSPVNMNDINVVFEGVRNMYWPLSVLENYYYLAALKGVFKNRVDYILNNDPRYSDVKSLLYKPFGELSLGQKQIVAVMSALLSSPELLCLDEPSNGLDVYFQNSLANIICSFVRDTNRKILITSHDLDFLYKTVQRFIVINDGKVIDNFVNMDMSFEEIKERYQNCIVRRAQV